MIHDPDLYVPNLYCTNDGSRPGWIPYAGLLLAVFKKPVVSSSTVKSAGVGDLGNVEENISDPEDLIEPSGILGIRRSR